MVLLTDGEDLEANGLDAARRAAEAGIRIETVGVARPPESSFPRRTSRARRLGSCGTTPGPRFGRASTNGACAPSLRPRTEPTGRWGSTDAASTGFMTRRSLRSRTPSKARASGASTPSGSRFPSRCRSSPSYSTRCSVGGLGRGDGRPVRPAPISVVWARLQYSRWRRCSHGARDASVQDAEKAYAAGKFDDSAREYEAQQTRHPKDARLAVDAGDAAYRAGHYDAAEAAFERALTMADPKLQQQALYDLGDARYRLGAMTLADAPDKTKAQWKEAIEAYEGALALSPADADARYNRDLVKRKLAELENKQKSQPPESQPKKEGDGHDADKGGAGKSGKGGRRRTAGPATRPRAGRRPARRRMASPVRAGRKVRGERPPASRAPQTRARPRAPDRQTHRIVARPGPAVRAPRVPATPRARAAREGSRAQRPEGFHRRMRARSCNRFAATSVAESALALRGPRLQPIHREGTGEANEVHARHRGRDGDGRPPRQRRFAGHRGPASRCIRDPGDEGPRASRPRFDAPRDRSHDLRGSGKPSRSS